MARSFTRATLSGAVDRLKPAMKVLLPPGCGEPAALVAEICRQSDRLRDLTLVHGIHLGDGELNCSLKTVVARGRASDADVLAHIAEFDERRLYLPAAYPCMKEYCIRELRFSEDAASKRVYAARAARQFPAIFAAVAEGRLHLSGVVTLASRIDPRKRRRAAGGRHPQNPR